MENKFTKRKLNLYLIQHVLDEINQIDGEIEYLRDMLYFSYTGKEIERPIDVVVVKERFGKKEYELKIPYGESIYKNTINCWMKEELSSLEKRRCDLEEKFNTLWEEQ
jgi:hypothetical protein